MGRGGEEGEKEGKGRGRGGGGAFQLGERGRWEPEKVC